MIRSTAIASCCALLAAPAPALDLPAGAVRQAQEAREGESARIPVAPWSEAGLRAVTAEGPLSRSAWRIGSTALTTLQILRPLRRQLVDEGYDIAFECADEACGGYDFRFALDVLPEPEMHVDLGDYRYLAALRDAADGGQEYLTLLVSRSPGAGYVQITQVGGAAEAGAPVVASTKGEAPERTLAAAAPDGPIGEALSSLGHVALDDLLFETGSAALGGGGFASLTELADWLRANPQERVTLVGHTDATGSLAGNAALSQRRAASVRARLVDELGVPASQVEAEGVGYLSPRASNLTAEGREKNRRVEVILTTTR